MTTFRYLSVTLLAALGLFLLPAAALASFMTLDGGLVLHSTGKQKMSFDFSIIEENADYESEFGYYNIKKPNKLNPIFSFNDEPPASVTMSFGKGDYGFYFQVKNEDVFAGTYGDIIDENHLVWKLSDNNAYFYLDDSIKNPDGDFNDMVVQGAAPAVPIPGAVWLLGSGLLGLVGFRAARSKG